MVRTCRLPRHRPGYLSRRLLETICFLPSKHLHIIPANVLVERQLCCECFSLCACWAEAPIKIARMTLTIKLDGNWSSFQLANSAPPLSVTDSAIAPSARISRIHRDRKWHQRTIILTASHNLSSILTSFVLFWARRFLVRELQRFVGTRRSLKNCISHIDASHSRQPLVKGERLVRYEVNAVMPKSFAETPVRAKEHMQWHARNTFTKKK